MKVCSNPKCFKKGVSQELENFYKKRNGHDAQCKSCINKSKKKNRKKDKRNNPCDFKVSEVILSMPCEWSFAKALAPLLEEGDTSE